RALCHSLRGEARTFAAPAGNVTRREEGGFFVVLAGERRGGRPWPPPKPSFGGMHARTARLDPGRDLSRRLHRYWWGQRGDRRHARAAPDGGGGCGLAGRPDESDRGGGGLPAPAHRQRRPLGRAEGRSATDRLRVACVYGGPVRD